MKKSLSSQLEPIKFFFVQKVDCQPTMKKVTNSRKHFESAFLFLRTLSQLSQL